MEQDKCIEDKEFLFTPWNFVIPEYSNKLLSGDDNSPDCIEVEPT
jgi:hypothetical protein